MRPGVYMRLFLLLGIAAGAVAVGCEDEEFSPIAQPDEDAAVEADGGDSDASEDDASPDEDAAPGEEDAAPDANAVDAGRG